MKIKSDGKSTDYYKIPVEAKTLYDLIVHKNMDSRIGFIFESCYILADLKPAMVEAYLLGMKAEITAILNNQPSKEFEETIKLYIPKHATELRHLISHKSMSKSRGDIFKSCYRIGRKDGIDEQYDLNKIEFFIQDLIEMHERGEHI